MTCLHNFSIRNDNAFNITFGVMLDIYVAVPITQNTWMYCLCLRRLLTHHFNSHWIFACISFLLCMLPRLVNGDIHWISSHSFGWAAQFWAFLTDCAWSAQHNSIASVKWMLCACIAWVYALRLSLNAKRYDCHIGGCYSLLGISDQMSANWFATDFGEMLCTIMHVTVLCLFFLIMRRERRKLFIMLCLYQSFWHMIRFIELFD